ncbi:MAG: hypothetical protein LBI27_01670 [Clostridiales bacterium]|nr:hypothetical protein [Clostridiales bacterium]
MKRQIDLLPPWAQNAKTSRKRIKIMAIAQIFILLVLIAIVFTLKIAERETWNYSRELSARIAAFDSMPMEIAEELYAARVVLEYSEEIYANVFNSEWLDQIIEAAPEGAALARLEYNAAEIIVAGIAEDLLAVEAYRASLSEIFTYVQQGRVTRMQDGDYTYEIRISPFFD